MVQTLKFSQFAAINLSASTNSLVGMSSLLGGGSNIYAKFPLTWTTATRPATPPAGLLGFNTSINQYEYWDGSSWVPVASGAAGTVTEVDTGTGLTGGPITTTGALSFAAIAANSLWANVTAGTAVPTVISTGTWLKTANNLSDVPTPATARSNLGLAIGTNVEAWSSILDSVASNSLPASVQLAVGSFNHGTGASNSTFWRGDGTWVSPTGSGTVNSGTINQLAYYAATGIAVSGLATANNGILKTSNTGVPSISTTAPAGITLPQPLIQGVTDGSSASAGNVGEYISSQVLSGAAIGLTSGTAANVTFIALTAGDWDVYANVYTVAGSGTLTTAFFGQINTTSATFTFPPTITTPAAGGNNLGTSATEGFYIAIGPARINVTVTTNVYLVAESSFSVSTQAAYGWISARRVR